MRIQRVTDVRMEDSGIDPGGGVGGGSSSSNSLEKTAMVRAARQLLSAITRVLLLADKVVIKQLIQAKNKVRTRNKIKAKTRTRLAAGALAVVYF